MFATVAFCLVATPIFDSIVPETQVQLDALAKARLLMRLIVISRRAASALVYLATTSVLALAVAFKEDHTELL